MARRRFSRPRRSFSISSRTLRFSFGFGAAALPAPPVLCLLFF
jgi:hypothetical protein